MLEEQSKVPPFTVDHVLPGVTGFFTEKVPMISELSWLDVSGRMKSGDFLFSSFLDLWSG